MEVIYQSNTLFHSLTHFFHIDQNLKNLLLECGYTDGQIEDQLKKPGSKFLPDFGKSPQEIVQKMLSLFPDKFLDATPEQDNKVRLSFCLNSPTGTNSLVCEDSLSPTERSGILTIERNGCIVRTINISREILTNECQIILALDNSDCIQNSGSKKYSLVTLFPGELAPPLPKVGEEPHPFWKNHLLIG